MESSWLNPVYHESSELLCLSTSVVAPNGVARDILTAYKVGEKAYNNFKKNRLEGSSPTESFYDKMSKQNSKPFSNVISKKTIKCGVKQIVLKAERNLFCIWF